jgi:hypothetical protein
MEQTARAKLSGFERARVGDEIRYYDGADRYALVSFHDTARVLWFDRRADGYWYSVK